MTDVSRIARKALYEHHDATGHDGFVSCGEDSHSASIGCEECAWQISVEVGGDAQ